MRKIRFKKENIVYKYKFQSLELYKFCFNEFAFLSRGLFLSPILQNKGCFDTLAVDIQLQGV